MNSLQQSFRSQFPSATFFDAQHLHGLEPILHAHGLLAPGEKITGTEKPGDGNMNFVLRVITNRQSLILKQSRPWVEKYPQIPAPVERLAAEVAYYEFIADHPNLRAMSPDLLAADLPHLIMLTADLGAGSDYSFVYQQGSEFPLSEIKSLFRYLAQLHDASTVANPSQFPANQALKVLNHEHIFVYPFSATNGFNLDAIQPGLQALAAPIQQATSLRQKLTSLGKIYLGSGPVLIHGDFYPGSWLRTASGLKIIDPEFSHFGHAEFDVGILLAHLFLARVPLESIKQGFQSYQHDRDLHESLAGEFCGVEILRRLFGLAQLPVDLSLTEKHELITLAKTFVMTPEASPLS